MIVEGSQKGEVMFDGVVLAAEAMRLLVDIQAPFQPGERILVVFGDTPIPGTIDSACSLAGSEALVWNVRTDASGQTYPIHEDFLRHVLVAARQMSS